MCDRLVPVLADQCKIVGSSLLARSFIVTRDSVSTKCPTICFGTSILFQCQALVPVRFQSKPAALPTTLQRDRICPPFRISGVVKSGFRSPSGECATYHRSLLIYVIVEPGKIRMTSMPWSLFEYLIQGHSRTSIDSGVVIPMDGLGKHIAFGGVRGAPA